MAEQRTFASMAWQGKGKVTRRERFLAEAEINAAGRQYRPLRTNSNAAARHMLQALGVDVSLFGLPRWKVPGWNTPIR